MARLEHAGQTQRLDLHDAHESEGSAAEGVLSTFDGLAIGETLLLQSDTALRPHYERLCAVRCSLFRWTLLEREGGKEQALITRLQPKDRETTVAAFFGRDHDEIDVLLEYTRRDLEGAARAGGALPVTLLPYFEEFKRSLEHQEIQRLLSCLKGVLRLSSSIGRITGTPGEIFEELTSILAAHNMKEEAVYYSLADRRLRPEETSRLLSTVTNPEG